MKKLLTVICLMLFSTLATAQVWDVQSDASKVSFISIKKGDVAEVHHFTEVSGALQGELFSLRIPLSSVNTNIDIRDQRMKSMLFEVAEFPELQLTAKVDKDLVPAMGIGEQSKHSFEALVSLHGMTQKLTVEVIIAKLSAHQLMVTSVQPVIVRADAFNLGTGIEKLRQVASLSAISWAVPVSFVLVLDK